MMGDNSWTAPSRSRLRFARRESVREQGTEPGTLVTGQESGLLFRHNRSVKNPPSASPWVGRRPIGTHLRSPLELSGDRSHMAMSQPALFQILLVVILRPVEFGNGRDLGSDRVAEPATRLQLLFGRYCGSLLLGTVKKDRRAVLCTDVGTLPVSGGRVVVIPEHLQQVFVRDEIWIVIYFHGFRVAGRAAADILVGWVLERASGVAYLGRCDARDLAESDLDSLETACCESGFLCHFVFPVDLYPSVEPLARPGGLATTFTGFPSK